MKGLVAAHMRLDTIILSGFAMLLLAANPGPAHAGEKAAPKEGDGKLGISVGALAGATFPVRPVSGACETFPAGPLAGIGAAYQPVRFFEVGLRVTYRYFRISCTPADTTTLAVTTTDTTATDTSSTTGGTGSTVKEDEKSESHVLLAGPIIHLGYAWDSFSLWALLGAGGGFTYSVYSYRGSSGDTSDQTSQEAEGWVEGGGEALFRLASSPVVMLGGLGASYVQPFIQDHDINGWMNTYLIFSVQF